MLSPGRNLHCKPWFRACNAGIAMAISQNIFPARSAFHSLPGNRPINPSISRADPRKMLPTFAATAIEHGRRSPRKAIQASPIFASSRIGLQRVNVLIRMTRESVVSHAMIRTRRWIRNLQTTTRVARHVMAVERPARRPVAFRHRAASHVICRNWNCLAGITGSRTIASGL